MREIEIRAPLARVTHSGFVDAKGRDDHGDGWLRVLAWLQDDVQRQSA